MDHSAAADGDVALQRCLFADNRITCYLGRCLRATAHDSTIDNEGEKYSMERDAPKHNVFDLPSPDPLFEIIF